MNIHEMFNLIPTDPIRWQIAGDHLLDHDELDYFVRHMLVKPDYVSSGRSYGHGDGHGYG